MGQHLYPRRAISLFWRQYIKGVIFLLCIVGMSFYVIEKYIKAVSKLEIDSQAALKIQIPQFTQGKPKALRPSRENLEVYNLSKKSNEDIECKKLESTPPTSVCIYDSTTDRFISGFIALGEGWETDIIKIFQNLLREDEELGLLDLGANIGLYSLIAAAMNRYVLSVEPVESNLMRLAKAVQINGYQDIITVLPYAVTDIRKMVPISLNPNNQGAHRLVLDEQHDNSPKREKVDVQTILMDDIEPFVPFKKAIMKIDVEGQEHKAFVHSKALMDKVELPYIFMEWEILRSYNNTDMMEDYNLTEQLIDLLTGYGYTPFDTLTFMKKPKLKKENWGQWPKDIIWYKNDK